MADFTIPYRAFQPVEPDITPGFNALMGVEVMKDRKERTGIAQQQTDMVRERMDMMKRQTELAEKEIPFKWLKQKAAMVGDISGQISQLPPDKRIAKYKDLIEKVIPMPLVEKSPLGPLGVGDPSKLLSPDEFAQLDDKGQKDYLGAQYKTSKDFVQFELEDLQNQNKTNQFRQQYEQDIDKIIKASQLRRGERAQDYAYDSKLAKEKYGYDKDLAGLKGELKGGKDGKGGVEFKAADNAPFFKALEPLYKFEMTEDGGFRFGGTEDEAKEMIAIASRANEIYKEGGTTHTTATKKAAEEFGKTFPGPKGAPGATQGNWRDYINVPTHRQDNKR